jgi:flagellar motility protein MotE (MotC chaperone)
MSHDADSLRSALAHVEEELEAAQRVDAETRARVAAALEAMRSALEREEASLRERREEHENGLLEMVEHFAESHPALSTSLGRLVDILAKMGI